MSKHDSKPLTCTDSPNPHKDPTGQGLLRSPFYGWGNTAAEEMVISQGPAAKCRWNWDSGPSQSKPSPLFIHSTNTC